MAQRYTSVVVDPSAQGRNRMKDAMRSVAAFAGVSSAASLIEAAETIKSGSTVDVVFLSQRLDSDESLDFIARAKTLANSRDAAFVVLVSSASERSNMAKQMVAGADGFLVEPYSVDQLVQITQLAERVRCERRDARFEKAAELLLSELMDQVDQLAMLKKGGRAGNISQQIFSETCSVLKTLEPALQDQYLRLAVERFSSIAKPRTLQLRGNSYTGASERVRKKFAARAIDGIRFAVGA